MHYQSNDIKQGPRGFQGKEGPTGERGPAGPSGIIGKPGSTGERGPRGYKGDKGDKGKDINITQYCVKIYNVNEELKKVTSDLEIENSAGGYSMIYSTDTTYFLSNIYIQRMDNKINIQIETNRQFKNIFLNCVGKSQKYNCFSITSDKNNIIFDFKTSEIYDNYFYISSILYLTIVWT